MGNTPSNICDAAEGGYRDAVAGFLMDGIDVNFQQPDTLRSALHNACKSGYPDIVKLLVKAAANVNSKDKNDMTVCVYQDILTIATSSGDTLWVHRLCEVTAGE